MRTCSQPPNATSWHSAADHPRGRPGSATPDPGGLSGHAVCDLSVGRNFDEILRVLDALQLNESGPFATPADWRPGDRAIGNLDIPTESAMELFPDLDVSGRAPKAGACSTTWNPRCLTQR